MQQPMNVPFVPEDIIGAGIALGLGLLVGIQRGWAQREMPDGARFAGIRTCGLLGLAGGLAGTLHTHAQGPALILLAATAALIVFGYRRSSEDDEQVSGTASMVGLLTMACGFVVAVGERELGIAIAAAMVLLLSLRSTLHGWVNNLNEKEMVAIARFAVIALVILPLLPDQDYGPYESWNPRQLWMVVVLVSGLSFVGYFASKSLGASRGNIATAAAGSLVSSTAVVASMSNKLKNDEGPASVLIAAICASSVVMYVRVMVLVGLLARPALLDFAILMAPGLLISIAAMAWTLRVALREKEAKAGELKLRNPFDLGPALMLTGLVMALTLASNWMLDVHGNQGVAVMLAISGAVDVDSAIITLGNLPSDTLDAATSGIVLAIPVALNMLFKAGIVLSIARWDKGKLGAAALAVAGIASVIAWPFLP